MVNGMMLLTPSQFPPGFLEESRAAHIVVGNAVCQILGTLVFFFRAYSRLVILNSWKVEDHVLTLAWLFATGFSICQYGQVEHGAGHHIAAILMGDVSDTVEAQKYAYAAQLVIFPALALSKISICLSYLRIFHADLAGRRMIQVLVVMLVLSIIPFDIESIFQCRPIHVYWSEGHPASKCSQNLADLYVNGSMNVVADIALIAIVLPRILPLQLNKRQKGVLISIALLGLVAVVLALCEWFVSG